nr:hypothetical protein [uncultured Sphingomonas sp.]
MKAVSKILTGAAAAAVISLGAAAPATAQYYPSPYGGYGGGLGDVITGAVLNSILRGGNPYGGNPYYGRQDYNLERAAVQQCAVAAEQRINSRYAAGYNQPYGGYNQPYGGYNQPYGYNQAGAYRVVQIDRVNRTKNGNMRVYGLATNAAYQGNYGQPYYGGYNQPYGGAYNQVRANFRFDCKFDRNGRISDLKVNRA